MFRKLFCSMSRTNEIRWKALNRIAPPSRAQKRAARPERKPSSRRCTLRVEQFEDRVTPSVLSVFELDGNVTTGILGSSGSTTTSHDWDQVFADNNVTPPPVSGAVASRFVTDAVNSNTDDIFQGGGSKDTQGIQQGRWLFTGSKPQAKDDISHAYAAAYTDPGSGHLILYAGLDRFDNSGNATAGFWFFRNQIGENPSVTTNGGHPFTGTHADGDILLVSDFTVGGSISTIKVFRWTGDDATGSLVAVPTPDPNSTFAIVNGSPISVPWSYTNKSGSTSPAAGEFLEEGVDLTALNLQGRFASFVAETRSSHSPTATLSDFVIGSLPLRSLRPTPFNGLSKVGDPVTYSLTVTNTGATPLFIQSVSDTLLGNIVVNHTLQQPGAAGVNSFVTSIGSSFDFTQSLAPGASLTVFVTRTVQETDPDPTNSTVTFIGTDDLAGLADPITVSQANSVNLFQPSVTLTETANPTTATALGTPITYTITVTNTSSADSPNLVLDTSNPDNSFTDTLLGDLEADAIAAGGGSLAPGASFTFTETRAIQAGDPTPLTNTATVVFTLAHNLGNFSNQITAQASASVTLLPHLEISKAVTSGFPDVIHPGDTASFTITVTNDGAGPATNVLVTDQLPAADVLTWTIASSTFDVSSISLGDFLTASSSSLAAGASESITVSAVIPRDIFGTTGGGTGNGDPVAAGVFELDGNATTGLLGTSGSTTTSHDWDQIFNDVTNGTSTSGAIAANFVTDPVNTNGDDIFQGGGSKDTQGIQQGRWLFTGSKPQGKDDITNAYATTYTDPATGDVILYAGLDRFDNSGDATAGFWFFRNAIGKNPDVTINGGHPFTGTHADGDILLVSDFTTGGSVSTVKVFRWTGDDSTGSLVPVATPPNSTFAIVNAAPITVPWSYRNKSGATSPAAGEFLEEGVDLTALGQSSCFASFLAETRSSQSPTATLSDFVIGSFNTCKLLLPNTATVQADDIAPITSNQVVITVLDGDAMQSTSVGGEAVTDGLTAQQLQGVLAQSINFWRAAGVDPGGLSSLANVAVHVGNLPAAELGFAAGGEIWIDRNAAGWGWSLDGAPGRMDLATVVTHELGHVLGFEHGNTGVMEAALAPGSRLVPEALTRAGTVVGLAASPSGPGVGTAVTAGGAPAGFRADAPGVARPGSPPSTSSPTGAIDAALATQVRGVTLLAAGAATEDGAGTQRTLTAVLLNLGPQAPPVLSAATAVPATVRAEPDEGSASALVPGLWPPARRMESGGGATFAGAEEPDAVPTGSPAPTAEPADTPVEPGATDQVGARSRQRACDACFADGPGMADPAEPSGQAAAAIAALAVLGGHWGAQRAETGPRRRRRDETWAIHNDR